ncbi:MAG: integrase arm-type DNA-binding domain-containing protein [Steroidobacter sp.]
MLNDTKIRNAKPRDKAFKLTDGGGLTLIVNPNGSRWWRLRYRFNGREKMLSLGVYPDVSLKQARDQRDEARRTIAAGNDPSKERQTEKAALSDTFELIAREWFSKHSKAWAPSHAIKIMARLQNDVFPFIGKEAITHITAPDLLKVLRRVEGRGALETAHRIHQTCGSVFRYAIATGKAERDVSADLRGALPPAKKEHHPSITEPAKIGALLRAIDGYDGFPVVHAALKLAPLVFVRPGELRQAEWREFDFENKEWRIPAERMKMKAIHIVPLSKQAIAILYDLQSLTGDARYVFPGARSAGRPLSDNALNAALRRMGYEKGTITAHGFRSMASTILNEQGFNRDWIERQLAHSERDGVRAAYNYAEYLPERRKMMQKWADYLDTLRDTRAAKDG